MPLRDVRFERRGARRDHYDDLRAELSPVFATGTLNDTVEEADVRVVSQIRPPAHVDGSVLPPVARAPFLGEHTDEVLGGLHAAHQAGAEGSS